ncbi:MAG: hypothetical protein H6550_10770 [Chitinophagales bacterium]|nr:hypothetical protein [Chitinophagales bacterium]
MHEALVKLRKTAIVLALLTLVGLVVDYMLDKINFPGAYTLFPISLLIITLLVMLVIWLFRALIQKDR